MKKSLIIMLAAALIGCINASGQIEPGVAKSLALQRSRDISDVRYSLAMQFPASKSEAVKGTVSINFYWRGTTDLLIDFQGKREQLAKSLRIIHKKGDKMQADTHPLRFENEHIIVPAAALAKGENGAFANNIIEIGFTAGDKALNRNDDYAYTLFVPDHARSAFPCFDQPDLKAKFTLQLTVPAVWETIANTLPQSSQNADAQGKMRVIKFKESDPLPTYLFSFACGRFQKAVKTIDGRQIECLYRETDTAKVAQLPIVFEHAAQSLRWLENYTGIKYPFQKFGFVILPGYQFGGMEHPGCIQLNDRSIFLGQHPTPDEQLNRLHLIAHETAHMWFGDLVTMRWFDDVWTKEVFANFMADKIAREAFPDIDHDINFVKSHYPSAMAVDRTNGNHPIQQPLENLNQASLLYGNIIYHKAPIMMRKLEQQMGEVRLQHGLRQYLADYQYGNATWDDLINILSKEAPDANLKMFDSVWVKQKGMPRMTCLYGNGDVVISQSDPEGRGLVWPQKVKVGLYDAQKGKWNTVEVMSDEMVVSVSVKQKPYAVLPNFDGEGYGRFTLDETSMAMSGYSWQVMDKPLNRFASTLNMYENYLMSKMSAGDYLSTMSTYLMNEEHPLVCSMLCQQICSATSDLSLDNRDFMEYTLMNDAKTHPLPAVRQQLMRYLSQTVTSEGVLKEIYDIWQTKSDSLLSDNDYTYMAYHLAVAMPAQWESILTTQRQRIKTDDDKRAFDYISRACSPDTAVQVDLFQQLLKAENRAVEPWARTMLSLLCEPLREKTANNYIKEGLNALIDIQQTGDIFFPGYWIGALLGGHHSQEARQIVNDWINNHSDFPTPLMNQVKQGAYRLLFVRK